MSFFTNPTSFRMASPNAVMSNFAVQDSFGMFKKKLPPHASHPDFIHLILLVFEAVMEVVCVSLPGYIVARQGMFDADAQKFVANLNVMVFTPCLIFTKLASQLTADKLVELAVIPFIFATQTLVSYLCAYGISKAFGFKKRPQNFVTAMAVFGNSNSLPISLILSLSQTIQGLHWDQIPGDNDDEVGARGILYLLIFQQLGQLVRWSWGYHVLLAPPEAYEVEEQRSGSQIEGGEYRDEVDEQEITIGDTNYNNSFDDFSGERTPITHQQYTTSISSISSESASPKPRKAPELLATPANGNIKPRDIGSNDNHGTSFPNIRPNDDSEEAPVGLKGITFKIKKFLKEQLLRVGGFFSRMGKSAFYSLPTWIQKSLLVTSRALYRFLHGVWEFMNPPLWAMFAALIVASVPDLQRAFFSEGTFINNSVARAISQSGGVAVPLILVVLGANLARNTIPQDSVHSPEDDKEDTKLLVAALISRMLLPTIIMAPLIALMAKFVPVSILDDPIFVIVCFLLTGAPSALQLAQICQINNVYMGVMAKLLFQSYVVWILPSTLILVMCALEVVEWAQV